jgi:hypothetical protein
MKRFLALLIAGVLLSIVGASVEGLLWLTVGGMLTFLGAVAYAVLSSPTREREDAEPEHRVHSPHPHPVQRQHAGPRQRATREPVSADVRVKAQRLPGVGWRYSMPADQSRQVMIVLEDGGSRHLVLVDPSLEEPLATVRMSDTDAGVVAALLTGARFDIEVLEDEALRRAPEKAVVGV